MTLRPRGSKRIYSFCRRNIPGSEGRFYVCDVNTMISSTETEHPVRGDFALVQTVSENIARYTKREVQSAQKARELLAKMGYPTVEMAVAMLREWSNFEVTEYDFKVADAIWGKDIASIINEASDYLTGCDTRSTGNAAGAGAVVRHYVRGTSEHCGGCSIST